MLLLQVLNFGLIALLFLFPAIAFPFEGNALISFQVQGNLNVHVRPNETSRIILSAEAEGPGTLDFRVGGVKPAFIEWDSRRLDCTETACAMIDTIYFTPTDADYGSHSFNVIARFFVQGKQVAEESRRVRINVTSTIPDEPAFSKGSSNQVCWGPFDDRFQYELLLQEPGGSAGSPSPAPAALTGVGPDTCGVLENLPEGVRFGYFVRATDPAGALYFDSNVVYSTQDNAAPPQVAIERFRLDLAERRLTLTWPILPDETSYLDSYVIARKPLAGNEAFVSRDTLAFFPVRHIVPASYYPVVTNVGESLYVDSPNADSSISAKFGSDFEIDWLPMNKLAGSAMIKTAINDRWNTDDEFLSFDLQVASWLYIAYDYDQLNLAVPEWLSRQFEPLGKSVTANSERVPLFKSRQIFQPGKVVLGGNFASGTSLVHKEPLMYVVFIQPVDAILPFVSGERISYDDMLADSDDGSTFRYRISVVDGAGNVSIGAESVPIVADLSSKCRPHPERWFDFDSPAGRQFSRGVSNLVTILDPSQDAECVGFRDTDSLRFQAARESASLFTGDSSTAAGPDFFDSGWMHVNDLAKRWGVEFSLLPTGEDPNFVSGKTYFYRVRAKDRFNNFSAWSDTVASTQDAFAPLDVSSLKAETLKAGDGATGCNQLTWQGGEDSVSGTRAFFIYGRREDATEFTIIDSVAAGLTSYCDSLQNFARNDIITYRIGSTDNVGNLRDALASSHEVALRALVGPTIQFDENALLSCSDGRTRVALDSIRLFWQNYDPADLAGYEVETILPDASKHIKVAANGAATSLSAPMAGGDGIYRFRVRAFYSNGDTTLFSNTLTIRRKVNLAVATNVTADQDQSGTGNISLTWSHPEMDEIEQFRIFAWGETEARPDTPIVALAGDITNWTHEFSTGTLVAYQCTNYAVQAQDCFGLLSEVESMVVQYSSPPLVFDESMTQVSDTDITVCWNRPVPLAAGANLFETTVLVYEDSVTTEPFATFTVTNETCFTFPSPQEMHNYIFQVRETARTDPQQQCADSFPGSISDRIIVPFKNLPRTVVFDAQALPVHPDSSTGRVFLHWDALGNEQSKFLIQYEGSGQHNPAIVELQDIDSLLITGLDITQVYDFDIYAVDSLGQRSLMTPTQHASFSPPWLFTPKVAHLKPTCFRDSVAVVWEWLDESLKTAAGNFGADSVIVEVSVEPDFSGTALQRRFGAGGTQSGTFLRARDLGFLNTDASDLHVRVRAQDRWGHKSPWSTAYPQLGAASGSFDDVPPSPAIVAIDSIQAPIFGGSGVVNVLLSWQDVADNCAGTWFYEVVRNDSVVTRDTSRTATHRFIERNLKNDATLLAQSWRVFAVDSVGNRQTAVQPVAIPLALTAPDSGWCSDDSTFCWTPSAQAADVQVSYIVEGARFSELFGNASTNILVGPTDSLCINFDVPWEQIFWRIKVRFGHLESAWSDTFFCGLDGQAPERLLLSENLQLVPEVFSLAQNYPNPFNPTTTIEYAIPSVNTGSVPVRLDVFNLKGQQVRTLVNENKAPANYSIVWDGRDDFGVQVGSGVYIYRIRTQGFLQSRKMLLVR